MNTLHNKLTFNKLSYLDFPLLLLTLKVNKGNS